MRSIKPVLAVVLMAAGCGGVSTRQGGGEMSDAGAPSGGAAAIASGGATGVPGPVDLGDGDHAEDGRPVVPTDSTGGFFWKGCSDGGWRIGNWFVTSDRQRDAFLREIEPPRDNSTQARGATGADFAAGVVLWVQLDHPANRPVSLSGCSAMSFWARLESSSGRVVVALNDGSQASGLAEGRATLPSRTLDVSPGWQEFTLPFDSFSIEGVAPDSLSVASIEFFVGDGGEEFDFWVDDLALTCAGGC
jgi:hypothetical protein